MKFEKPQGKYVVQAVSRLVDGSVQNDEWVYSSWEDLEKDWSKVDHLPGVVMRVTVEGTPTWALHDAARVGQEAEIVGYANAAGCTLPIRKGEGP